MKEKICKTVAWLLILAGCLSMAACASPGGPEDTSAATSTGETETIPAVSNQDPQITPVGDYTPVDDSPKLLPDAKWIWAETTDNNVWVDFRKTFTLDQVPEEAIAEIAVENKYFLWINGQMVVYDGGLKRGPNKTDGYFDRVDLAPYLQPGENTIAIKAWFWGIKSDIAQSYSNVPVDTAGLLFAADVGGQMILSDGSWRAFQDAAFQDDTDLGVPQPNIRLPEYNIYYCAADTQDAGWTEPEFDDSAWGAAQERGSYGDAPWNELHLRSIPMLVEYGLTDYLNSADYVGYTTTEDEEITMRVPYNAQLAPYLEVSAREQVAITIVTENTESCESLYTTYVTSADGEQSFESPAWISGQFITYKIPAGVTILRLAYRESGYDTRMSGSFSMDDEFFDTLWQMGARTQYLCIRENFMDCPDRERAQWTGDAANQMRQMMYCLDPSTYALYSKAAGQKAAWVETEGKYKNLMATVAPIYNEFYELPAQELAFIVSIWDYYLYTGDSSVLHIAYEPCLNYLQIWKTDSKTGLVKHKTGRGLGDWQDTGSNRVDTKVSENAWYYWALSTMRKMALALEEDTSWLDETMQTIYDGYQALWVEGLGYATGSQADDRGNALAVLSGLAPEEHYDTIANVLTNNMLASSYMEAYVLEALCRMNRVSEALDRMETRFGEMVQTNQAEGYTTLWEYFDKNMGTRNHAWSASPVYLLSRYVGGIRPTAPGYTEYEIVPDFSHSNHVSITAATVLGEISMDAVLDPEANACTLTVELPDAGVATVAVPRLEGTTITANGSVIDPNGGQTADGIRLVSQDESYCYFEVTGGGRVLFGAQ